MLILAYLNLPNLITLAGMLCGLSSMILSLHAYPGFALLALVCAGICDLLDGHVARRMSAHGKRSDAQSQFGQTLDSLVDVINFGMAPMVFIYALQPSPSVSFYLCAGFYVACAVLRLAYFTVHGLLEDSRGKYYSGLPVTYAALLLPVTTLPGLLSWPLSWLLWLLHVWPLLIGSLFISRLRFRKPGSARTVSAGA